VQWQKEGALDRYRAVVLDKAPKAPFVNRVSDAFRTIGRMIWRPETGIAEYQKAAAKVKPLGMGEDVVMAYKTMTRHSQGQAARAPRDGVRSLLTGKKLADGIVEAMEKIPDFKKADLPDMGALMAAMSDIDRAVPRAGHKQHVTLTGSLADAQHVVQTLGARPGWLDFARKATEYHNALVHMFAEAGGLSPQAEAAIVQAMPSYTPFKRLFEDMERVDRGPVRAQGGQPVKRRTDTGGMRPIENPLIAAVQMTEDFYRAAGHAILNRKIIDLQASRQGLGQWVSRRTAPIEGMQGTVESIKAQLVKAGADLTNADMDAVINLYRASRAKQGDAPVISIYRNGKLEWYDVHPEIYKTIAHTDPVHLPAFLEATLGTATKVLRTGATGIRTGFNFFTNPLRDFITHWMRTEGSTVGAPGRWIGALVRQLTAKASEMAGGTGDPSLNLLGRWGTEQSGMVGQDIVRGYRNAVELYRESQGRGWVNATLHPLRTVQELISGFERTGRSAEAFDTMERGMKEWASQNPQDPVSVAYANAGGSARRMVAAGVDPPFDVMVQVANAFHNVITDFGQAGDVMRWVNRVKAYSNAPIRDFLADAAMFRNHPARTMVRGLGLLTIPSLAYWWMIKDEDWFKVLPAWRKYGGWNFRVGNQTLTIPNPFLIGTAFAQIPMAMADSVYRQDPKALGDLGAYFGGQYAPNRLADAMPDLIRPMVELAENKDFAGRPIEPRAGENLPPEERYGRYTTTTSRWLGKMLPDILKVSPYQLDHLIGAYSGGMVRDLLQIPTEGPARAIGYGSILRPEVSRDPDDFYRALEAATQAHGAQMAGRKGYDAKAAAQYARLSTFSRILSDYRKRHRAAATEEQATAIYRHMVGLARKALNREPLASYPTRKP
jgi:hypothetical protein